MGLDGIKGELPIKQEQYSSSVVDYPESPRDARQQNKLLHALYEKDTNMLNGDRMPFEGDRGQVIEWSKSEQGVETARKIITSINTPTNMDPELPQHFMHEPGLAFAISNLKNARIPYEARGVVTQSFLQSVLDKYPHPGDLMNEIKNTVFNDRDNTRKSQTLASTDKLLGGLYGKRYEYWKQLLSLQGYFDKASSNPFENIEFTDQESIDGEVVFDALHKPGRHSTKLGTYVWGTGAGGRSGDNQDRVAINHKYDTIIVVDGMGGMTAGDKAAQIVAEELARRSQGHYAYPRETLETAQIRIADVVKETREFDPHARDSGACYLNAQIKNNGDLVIDQLGDVRLVVYRGNEQVFETSDGRNLQFKGEDVYSVVEGVVGGGNLDTPRNSTYKLEPQDLVLVFSDGISDNINSHVMPTFINPNSPEETYKKLVNETLKRMASNRPNTKPDNVSLVVFQYKGIN